MKKWTKYVAVALSLVLSFSLVGCSLLGSSGDNSGDRNSNSSNTSSNSSNSGGGTNTNLSGDASVEAALVGTWQEIDIDNKYVFRDDKTGSEFYDGTEYKMKSWKVDGGKLIMDFGTDGIEEYTFTLNGDTLKVDGDFGMTYEYKRQ